MMIKDKLNLSKYKNMAVLNQPGDYDIFTDNKAALSGEHDAIFIFVESLEEMVEYTQKIINEQRC